MCLLSFGIHLDVPDGSAEPVLLSAGIGDAHVASLRLAEVHHRAACQVVLPLVGKEAPLLAVVRCFDEVLVELRSIFPLRQHRLYRLRLAQVYLNPLLAYAARSPQGTVVVVRRIFGAEVLVVVRRGPYGFPPSQVLPLHRKGCQGSESLVCRHHRAYAAILGKLQSVDGQLAMEPAVGVWVVMTVVHDVVVVPFLQHAVVSRSVNRPVAVGLQNATPIGIGTQRLVCRSILHAVGVVVARTAGVHEVVHPAPLQHEGSFKEVGCLCVGYQACFAEALHVRSQLAGTASESLVDAPCAPVHIYRAVVVHKGLSVQRDGVGHETVWYQHRFALSQNVLPGAAWCLAHTAVHGAGLAVVVIVFPVRVVHHVGCPYPVAVRPVHRHQGPVDKVLAAPYLGRSEAGSATVCGGIDIIGVAKLLYGGVGEVARQEGVACLRSVVGFLPEGGSVSQQQGRDEYQYVFHQSEI